MLEVDSLCLAYGETIVVRDVSLSVASASVVTVLGANGGGKSTLGRGIAGLLPARRGDVLLEGRSIAKLGTEKRVRAGISLVPEGRALFPGLSVQDNLRLGAFLHRGHRELDDVLEMLPALASRLKQEAGTLSGGEQQMLAIGRALMSRPTLLILDEPTLGFSPQMSSTIFRLIREMASRGMGVLLIEQNARAALKIADYALILERGRVAVRGEAVELRDDDAVVNAYLGVTA